MFSNELAEKLINLPKSIQTGNSNIDFTQERNRFILKNDENPSYLFLFEFTINKKVSFRISLHNQEDNSKEGLIRIDYKGGHRNPEELNKHVPEFVKPYIGYQFTEEAHVHIYVEGFKNLAWAIPLTKYDFSVKDVNSTQDLENAVTAFMKQINIITPVTYQTILL